MYTCSSIAECLNNLHCNTNLNCGQNPAHFFEVVVNAQFKQLGCPRARKTIASYRLLMTDIIML